ncbi:hypothetical protein ElyMa_005263700 [Elysia marginata]|uniref:Uncharacterized protein n=1 Tax=Elysia marginata TaxID=1093978 RepID=A0AAV4K0V2_9GAST|nr:hypothetical protein ElyMa_005263700 [Elysia marginata]
MSILDLLDLGDSASQCSDGDTSAASRILVASLLQLCMSIGGVKSPAFERLLEVAMFNDDNCFLLTHAEPHNILPPKQKSSAKLVLGQGHLNGFAPLDVPLPSHVPQCEHRAGEI